MEEERLSLYDARLQSREINMLKTALPYVSPSAQKNLSMMIAFLQMEKTIEFFFQPGKQHTDRGHGAYTGSGGGAAAGSAVPLLSL